MSDRDMDRRRYLSLAATAVAAGVAGCSGGQSGPGAGATSAGAATGEGGAAAGAATTSSGTGNSSDRQLGGREESVYTRLYERTVGSVVLIRAPGGSLGTGWVYDKSHIVTNYHVVTGAETVDVRFSREASVAGEVVGRDPYADLAVIRVPELPDYAEPLPLAKEEPAIGTRVAVIGSPYGLEGSLTEGVVSGVNRRVPSPAKGTDYRIPNAIQTSAPVNPGNSGGPLVNLEGTVLGVVNSGGGENIAFAISAPLVRQVVPALIEDGTYQHPYLGVNVVDVTQVVAEANDLQQARGLLVTEVDAGSPAAGTLRASQREARVNGFSVPVGGDVVLAVGGKEVESVQGFYSYLELNARPGETVTLTVLRDGERRQVTVEVGAREP